MIAANIALGRRAGDISFSPHLSPGNRQRSVLISSGLQFTDIASFLHLHTNDSTGRWRPYLRFNHFASPMRGHFEKLHDKSPFVRCKRQAVRLLNRDRVLLRSQDLSNATERRSSRSAAAVRVDSRTSDDERLPEVAGSSSCTRTVHRRCVVEDCDSLSHRVFNRLVTLLFVVFRSHGEFRRV